MTLRSIKNVRNRENVIYWTYVSNECLLNKNQMSLGGFNPKISILKSVLNEDFYYGEFIF